MNTDGNTAALNKWQREQDKIAEAEEHLERLQQELANDLFDAYVSKNYAVIDEVNDYLIGTDTTDNLINSLRLAMTKECERPVMGRGGEIYEAYLKVIDEVCLYIAKKCQEPDDFNRMAIDFGL